MRLLLSTMIVAGVLCLGTVVPSQAQVWQAVQSKSDFVSVVTGRQLTRLGIRLDVTPGGQITGRAFGMDITGSWDWSGQFFCRTMSYGNTTLANNCQQVLVQGDTIRFIADEGAGDRADLTLR